MRTMRYCNNLLDLASLISPTWNQKLFYDRTRGGLACAQVFVIVSSLLSIDWREAILSSIFLVWATVASRKWLQQKSSVFISVESSLISLSGNPKSRQFLTKDNCTRCSWSYCRFPASCSTRLWQDTLMLIVADRFD